MSPARATSPGANGKIALESCGPRPCEERGLWLTNPDGSGLERLIARGSDPAWSATGRRVAFSDDRFGTSDIFTVRAGGGELERLTQSEANDLQPTWSPDGGSIAFTRRRSGSSAIYVMSSAGTGVEIVPGTQGGRDPAWAPVGDQIAFAAPGSGSMDIKVVDLSTQQVETITSSAEDDSDPSWSPDAQELAFERGVTDGNIEIFATDALGVDSERLTTRPGNDTSPTWSPNGQKIAFLGEGDGPGLFTLQVPDGSIRRLKTVRGRRIDWQACASTGECPGGVADKLDTSISLVFEKTQRKILASGRARPALPGERVKVTLSRRRPGGSFQDLAVKRPELDQRGRYKVSFARPERGTCRLVVSFPGDDNYARSRAAKTFKCAVPLHLVSYSPEQLPSHTERALEKIDGVKATWFWSGSKFMKFSRTKDGTYVDRPQGSYNIPLDVAFVQPREFARFAQPRDREAIRGLLGNEALLAEGEVGLRKGHNRLRMRYTIGRARSVGVISNKSAQGYELILPMPAPRASVAFRTVLIEKPPGVSRRRIARKLRRLVGSKPVELRSEKQVPYLRHGMLVRPQLFVKRAFGEFSMRPASGRSIDIGGSWVRNHIRTDGVPILGRVTCHRKIFPQLRRALEEVRKRGLAHTVTRSNYAGCFNPRFISSYTGSDVGPVKRLSRHAFGIALDINAATNAFGSRPRQDRRLVRIMRKWGFTWGGRWAIPDGMHFEWERFP
ncbi:MAG: M15 family metallopeptidase [Actinomycetota bacterium]|nr:M15 family metallopeptidase [Actinomycetota bacterium]